VGETGYDRRRLSYAGTFADPVRAAIVAGIEAATGKLHLSRLIRRFEAMGVPDGQAFWQQALEVMGIALTTPPDEIARIPAQGPLVVVANHPHGLVDGMVLAELVGRRRLDYRILTRALLTGVGEIDRFMIPVPFAHDPDAQARNLAMRRVAMMHLDSGGTIILFPAGSVAASPGWWSPAVEAVWNPFTAKLIQRSGAQVVPVRFTGQNSRWYQIANRVSPVLRQGLLLHEVVHALGRPQRPVVGHTVDPAHIAAMEGDPRGFMAWLRDLTLSLDGA
jgi:putative hemolysin